jgi:hypothetical protein
MVFSSSDKSSEQNGDDLRLTLSEAIASQAEQAADTSAATADHSREEAAHDGLDTTGEVAGDAEATGADAPAGVAADEAALGAQTEQPRPPGAPANWKASDRDMFKQLPERAQRFLLERHKAMEADHTRKTQAIADFRREYEPIDQIFAPYRDVMSERGLTARSLIEGWAGVERRLAEGDGIDVIKGLVAGYQLDPAGVASALGILPERPPAAARASAAEPSMQAPAGVPAELLQDVARLRQRADDEDRAKAEAANAAREAARQRFAVEVETFKNARDEEGNLLHPHIDDVQEDMVHLALAAKSRGQEIPALPELYERAVRANPSTYRAQRIADQQSAERKQREEARAKAAAAKRASASVTGSPGPGQSPAARPSGRTLREELESAADYAA